MFACSSKSLMQNRTAQVTAMSASGHQAISKPGLAPIFNYHKRVRHAFFAHPSDETTIAEYPEPPSHVRSISARAGFQYSCHDRDSGGMQQPQQNSSFGSQVNSTPGRQYMAQQQNHGQPISSYSVNSRGRELSIHSTSSGNPGLQKSGQNTCVQFPKPSNNMNKRKVPELFAPKDCHNSKHIRATDANGSTFGNKPSMFQHQQHPHKQIGNPRPAFSPFSETKTFTSGYEAKMNSMPVQLNTFGSNAPNGCASDNKKKWDNTKDQQDKSLHVLTTNVTNLKQSIAFKDKVAVLFEVFGMLDSAVVNNDNETGREFVLRDDRDSLHCIYFEIDRPLPRMTRGYWYRIMGNYDEKLQRMKCVSVRPTSNAEKSIIRSSCLLGEKVIRIILSNNREI